MILMILAILMLSLIIADYSCDINMRGPIHSVYYTADDQKVVNCNDDADDDYEEDFNDNRNVRDDLGDRSCAGAGYS